MSCSDFAKLMGCRPRSVYKAIRCGRLLGSIQRDVTGWLSITDVDLAMAEWRAQRSATIRCISCGAEFTKLVVRRARRLCPSCRCQPRPGAVLIVKIRREAARRRALTRASKKARALQLRAEGLSQTEVASAIGISLATIRVWCRNTGHASVLTRFRSTAAEMLRGGHTPAAVAEKLGLGEETIRMAMQSGVLPRRGTPLKVCSVCGAGYQGAVWREAACGDECRRVLVIAGKRAARRRVRYGTISSAFRLLIPQQVLLQRELQRVDELAGGEARQ